MGLGKRSKEVGIEVFEVLLIRSDKHVAIFKAQTFGLIIELHTHCHILNTNIRVAPIEQNHRVNEQSEQEINQYAARHYQQTLPRWLATKLPRLYRLFHLFSVEALVYHTCDLAITAQRQPAYAVNGIASFRFELEKMEPWIEEKIKLVDPDAEEL